mgnify:CR=1 FL=1
MVIEKYILTILNTMSSCKVFCCYTEPNDPVRCGKKVKKKGNIVRCKREGVQYCDKAKQWFCAIHHAQIETFILEEIAYSPKRVIK